MKTPNGHDIEIGDVWEYLPGVGITDGGSKTGHFLIVSFDVPKEDGRGNPLEFICQGWIFSKHQLEYYGWAGPHQNYRLISRIT